MEFRVACIIRNTGSGWSILSDIDHQPIGVSHVTQHADHIKLYFSFTATKVHTFNITPDETYGAFDQAVAGASVGLTHAGIIFARPGVNGAIDPALLCNPVGNFFIYGLLSG